ncbi:hypothetical protein [Legionella quinlivanii]|uniref:hypothetical protein n=1 Tax=Legionella quinlivanii TaxID=45073 RepID=UPI0022443B09|nr:hypothetical protein [Legionella quinlivanii]MCW8452374.1 hypothetical protein [Legionella quinlivanii]
MRLFGAKSVEELKNMLETLDDKSELSQINSENQTPIMFYAAKSDWDKVAAFTCITEVSVGDAEQFGRAALLAAKAGKMELAIRLLKINNASREERIGRWNILHYAALHAPYPNSSTEKKAIALRWIQELLALPGIQPSCSHTTDNGYTPILLAAYFKKWYLVEALINGFNDVEDSQAYAEVIFRAEDEGLTELSGKILAGISPETLWLYENEEIKREVSPLHLAILRSNKEAIINFAKEPCLSRCTARTLQNRAGFSPVRLAAQLRDWNTVEFLTKEQTDETDRLQYGSAMVSAAHHKQFELASALAAKGANLDWKFNNTENGAINAFHIAVQENQEKFLVALAVRYNQSTSKDSLLVKYENRTPIEWAVDLKHWHLLPHFAKMTPSDPQAAGYTAAYEAARAANALKTEELELLWEAAYPELVPAENERFVAAFKKIYQALYMGQSSWFKSSNFVDQHPTLTRADIRQHIAERPFSRSKFAAELTLKYKDRMDDINLVREIHQYAYQHSGFFKRSLNGHELLTDNGKTVIENAGADSRTGLIRTGLGL